MAESDQEFNIYDLEKDLLYKYGTFMRLRLFVDSTDDELKQNMKSIFIRVI